MRLAAVTLSVNNPDEPVRLTKEQLFRGLLAKARDPTQSIHVIVRCDILDTFPTGLRCEVELADRPGAVHEMFEFFPPSKVVSTMTSPSTAERLAQITNVISATQEGEMLLIFTFAWGGNGELDVGEEAGPLDWNGRVRLLDLRACVGHWMRSAEW
ncbi:uncharacterized protein B0H18DRAFT_1038266 [Fomitopsis serialis]|uniref:uncharacterized protein n=1 Tax=Fomitopsis serialis TaxID=139415 RepID=UPI0020083CB6|nr:uncharacterized protein B0H18DRAFT_1038266 [Neoantrodia serialis]KAH9916469.1 hypothetical protein B0H18DRAFT_1038266 [Neoantrodia serialis]